MGVPGIQYLVLRLVAMVNLRDECFLLLKVGFYILTAPYHLPLTACPNSLPCSMQQTWKIIVHGKVQGVFYRQSTAEQANVLGVNGTVRNLPDGSVEIYAQGTLEQLKSLADWCRRGPARANVSGITTESLEQFEQFKGFKVLR